MAAKTRWQSELGLEVTVAVATRRHRQQRRRELGLAEATGWRRDGSNTAETAAVTSKTWLGNNSCDTAATATARRQQKHSGVANMSWR